MISYMELQPFQLVNPAAKSDGKKDSSLLWTAVSFAVLVALFFVFFTYNSRNQPLPSGYSAHDIYSGQAVSLRDYRGSVIILTSWATWCMDCKEELAALESLWNSERERGLVVIAVNLDAVEADERIANMVARYDLTYPVWRDPENVFFSTFNTPGIPTTVLLDRQGVVMRAWVGPVDFVSADFKSEIEAVLTR
jgi:peroxiredoxin